MSNIQKDYFKPSTSSSNVPEEQVISDPEKKIRLLLHKRY